MGRLKDKVALVTGAAQRIGEAIARAFIAEGAWVYLTNINDEAGRRLTSELGVQADYRRLDVRRESDWEEAMAVVLASHGHLDVLVNNARATGFETGPAAHDPENTTLANWRRVHETNLDGVFLGCKHGIRAMRASGGGSIINLSSRSGLVGIPGAAAYASSKAAIRNHTKTVALYCAGEGLPIRCNSIHPAAILTPMWEPMLGEGPERQQRMAAVVRDTPMQRFGRSDEVAAIALVLASDEVAYMTGTELNLDGGLLAGAGAAPERV